MAVKLFAHQEATAEFLAKTPRAFVTSDPGCVSADTEFLTPSGWKRIDQYAPGDKVCQYDKDRGKAQFVTPIGYIKKPCDRMLVFKPSRGVDQKLSAEHRVLYRRHGTHRLAVESAGDIYRKHLAAPNGFSGKILNTFDLELPDQHIKLTEPQLRVVVACIADGYFPNHGNRCVIRLKKPRKKQRLHILLRSAGIPYTCKPCLPDGFDVFSFVAPRRGKVFTHEFWQASREQLEIIVDEAMYWDSSKDARGTGSFRFSTTVKESADFLQYACAASGRTSSLTSAVRHRRGRVEIEYNLHILNRSVPSKLTGRLHSNVWEEPTEDGYKYCFTVPSTFWVMRRNGYVAITGNTGKTISTLEGYRRSMEGRLLVLAPLSILQPSWGNDIDKFMPGFTYEIAHGTPKRREQAILSGADIVITNTDAVNWIAKKPDTYLKGFSHLVIDEFPAFKNRTAQRSKAVRELTRRIPNVWMLSGTPNSNTILDIWYPAFLLDGGQRLGKHFWGFRSQVCTPVQNGPNPQHVKWVDKDGAEDVVADLLKDITIRYRFEECNDIPENHVNTITLQAPQWLMAKYIALEETSVLETEEGQLSAIHAGAKVKKLLQLLSGAVYDEHGEVLKVHTDRYELVMDLAAQREQCVVAYNWHHELEALKHFAEKAGFSYAVINGSVNKASRDEAVRAFQAGELKFIFAHPQSASHGLTLTRGTTTIWCSPTYNAEHYKQFNHRIYRTGQTRKTETLRIAYTNTKEVEVYDKLDGKLERMEDLLALFTAQTKRRNAA